VLQVRLEGRVTAVDGGKDGEDAKPTVLVPTTAFELEEVAPAPLPRRFLSLGVRQNEPVNLELLRSAEACREVIVARRNLKSRSQM
jgi:hypothetical protein